MAFTASRIGASTLRNTFRVRPRSRSLGPLAHRQSLRVSCSRRNEANDSNNPNRMPSPPVPTNPSSSTESPPEPLAASTSNAPRDVPTIQPSSASAEKLANKEAERDTPFEPKNDINFDKILTPEERAEAEALLANPPEEYRDIVTNLKSQMSKFESRMREIPPTRERQQGPDPLAPPPRYMLGLLAQGERPHHRELDDEWEGDDVTALAHAELDQHRDLRDYMRIAAWEMPKLMKLATPFEPPSAERPLRFRYTSYMGESHPAENKVVVEFCTIDLPLKPEQRLKLIKLLGPRYNPQLDLVKMSCESFSSQAQNKRFLGDQVKTLLRAARGEGDTPEAKDSFADVPVDFRHVKWKKRLQFPEAWKMTPARQRILAERRAALEAEEQQRIDDNLIVDGVQIVAESVNTIKPQLEPVERKGQSNKGRPMLRMR